MRTMIVSLFCIALLACEGKPAESFLDLQNADNVIYGDVDITEELLPHDNSLASVALVKREALEEFQQGILPYTVEEVTGLADFDWKNQTSFSFCSGVLVAPDLVLTAGHCVAHLSCEDLMVVSGYDQNLKDVSQLQTRTCQRIEAVHARLGLKDWALIRLQDKLDLPVAKLAKGRSKIRDEVYSIGYPLGAPKKRSLGKIRFVDFNKNYRISLDAFVGQSGSPVFNQSTHELIGILSSGESDDTDNSGSLQVKYCAEADCLGELIISVENILPSQE